MADKSEFENLAMPYIDNVYRVAVALCKQQDMAEDLTQAAFIKALERFGTFRTGTNCKAWLLTILRNTWIDELRHRMRTGTQVPIEESLLPDRPHAEPNTWTDADDVLENFSDADVIQAMKQLPDEQRLTLFLVDVEQLDHEEVAEITQVAVGTVKSRSSRARATLRQKLQAHAKELGFVERKP